MPRGDNDRWIAEPGVFDLWGANSAVDGLTASFELLGGQGKKPSLFERGNPLAV
jgi:hypothetical protein